MKQRAGVPSTFCDMCLGLYTCVGYIDCIEDQDEDPAGRLYLCVVFPCQTLELRALRSSVHVLLWCCERTRWFPEEELSSTGNQFW